MTAQPRTRRRWRRPAGVALIVLALAGVPALARLGGFQTEKTVYAVSLNTPDSSFAIADLRPGDYVIRCFRVRNEGATVARLTGSFAVTGTLAPYLLVRVDSGHGLGDHGPSCDGFAADGGHAFGTGSGAAPSQLRGETVNAWPSHAARSYRVLLYLAPGAGNEVQGLGATASMAWKAAAPVVAKPRIPRLQINRRTGVITFTFAFPAAARLDALARFNGSKTYGKKSVSARGRATKTVRIVPGPAARRALRKARRGLPVQVMLRYRPVVGQALKLQRTVRVPALR
jgi:hypothetical protein